jgi:hypothetical protein
VLLPCSVVIRAVTGRVVVEAFDPSRLPAAVGDTLAMPKTAAG